MPDLSFQVEDAHSHSRTRLLRSCHVQGAHHRTPRRSLSIPSLCVCRCRSNLCAAATPSAEQEQLKELFGETERWSKSLHPLLWANINVNVPAFTGSTVVDVPVPCTFDFNVAMTKYILRTRRWRDSHHAALQRDRFLRRPHRACRWRRFRGIVRPAIGCRFSVWKEMMDLYYPNTAWLCSAARRIREAVRIQVAARNSDLGAGSRAHAGSWPRR